MAQMPAQLPFLLSGPSTPSTVPLYEVFVPFEDRSVDVQPEERSVDIPAG